MDDGENILITPYVLWCHQINNSDWSINGYKKLCTIKNISEFWRLFNNFKKIGWKSYHFYLMREGIKPRWEDNPLGGELSFRVDINNALIMWEKLGVLLIANQLYTDMEKINGISINIKKDFTLIKVWTKSEIKLTNEYFNDYKTHYENNEIKLLHEIENKKKYLQKKFN